MWDRVRCRARNADKDHKRKTNMKGMFLASCKEPVPNSRDSPFDRRWRGRGLGKPQWDNTRALDLVLAHVSSSELSIVLPLCLILPASRPLRAHTQCTRSYPAPSIPLCHIQ